MKKKLFYVAVHPLSEVLYSVGLKKVGASLYIAGAAICGIRLGE